MSRPLSFPCLTILTPPPERVGDGRLGAQCRSPPELATRPLRAERIVTRHEVQRRRRHDVHPAGGHESDRSLRDREECTRESVRNAHASYPPSHAVAGEPKE